MSFYREKKVKTRKPHRCFGCITPIPVGSTVTYTVGTVDGEFCAAYHCDLCNDFLDKHPNYFNDDIFYEGDIGEARRQEEQERGQQDCRGVPEVASQPPGRD